MLALVARVLVAAHIPPQPGTKASVLYMGDVVRNQIVAQPSPQQSNNLFADARFKRHLHRPTVPLLVPTIENEKCMTMTYLSGITSPA